MRCSRAITTVTTMTREPTLIRPREMSPMPMPNIDSMKRARSTPFVTRSHSDHHHSRRWERRWRPIDSPDVLPLEGHLAGELDGVDVGRGVDHPAPQLGRGLGVGEAQLVQPPDPEHVDRDVDRHPGRQGEGEVGVGQERDPQVGEEADDPGEELPEPLRDQALGSRRGVRDLVDERAREAVGEVGRRVLREVAEEAAAGLGHGAGDPAHAAEAARAPDDLVRRGTRPGKTSAQRQISDDVAASLAEGDRGVGEQLQRVGHDPRRRGGDQHGEHRRDRPSARRAG